MGLTRFNLAGRNVVPSDLQYLTDENIAEIGMRCQLLQPRPASRFAVPAGGEMTHIEKMRLQAALQALSGTHASLVTRVELMLALA